MRLLQTLQTSYTSNSYVLDGCLCNGTSSIALSTSQQTLRLYDSQTTTFLFDLTDHTKPITDVVATSANPHMLYSSQSDSGVMISDLRQGKAVHFLTEMASTGVTCNSISISPSGETMAIATDGDIHLLDCKTWQSKSCIEKMHTDEVSRVRFLNDNVICSAGEDQMINFMTTDPSVCDDDVLLQATCCGEVVNKMSCLSEVGLMSMVGSCENGYLYPFDLEKTETRFERPDFQTYLVDWCVLGGQLCLVLGRRDDDGNAGPLSVLNFETKEQHELRPMAHGEICRMAMGIGNRLITGGEDGLLAFWVWNRTVADDSPELGGAASIASTPHGVQKAYPTGPYSLEKKGPKPHSANGKSFVQFPRRRPGKPY
ncbi:unnamed protein product [Phytomonas sp. EM1]|nr:unnamed protein product [Phytomonas sp. EM1]|eukprot:CCW60388.1 unnamed protein product [Phytomonas sp. isolate EM1]